MDKKSWLLYKRPFYQIVESNGIEFPPTPNRNALATGPRKKFDDIFSHVDTVHQRDGQMDRRTDGQTPGDNKDRANAQRRAVKTGFRFLYIERPWQYGTRRILSRQLPGIGCVAYELRRTLHSCW